MEGAAAEAAAEEADRETGFLKIKLAVGIKAEKTVTFGLAKTGFIKNHGPLCIGELIVADVLIPNKLLR